MTDFYDPLTLPCLISPTPQTITADTTAYSLSAAALGLMSGEVGGKCGGAPQISTAA